ncbi:MAG: polysaccharide biosynthesis protein [Eubacterium sp.]|nr:polysaccharide biosynthesis protein [Eubacterium sp.]
MSTENGKKSADFLKQGGILAMASLIVRFIGMIYRIPMSNILGETGNGIYAVAFEIYDVILVISSYSLPLALSKIISAQQAQRQHKNTGRTFRVALMFAVLSGGLFCLLLFFGAGMIEEYIYPEYAGVQIPLRVLAPTVFIVALLGVFRGFFQGKKTMVPTAVSQIVEQIVNAIVSVAASYLFMKWNIESLQQAAWGAAGGTLGTCLGAASALLIVLFVYWIYRPVQTKLERRDRNREQYSGKQLFVLLIFTILPIVLSQTVYNISGLIDYKIFGWLSGNAGQDSETISSLVGVYSSKYRLLCSVPIAISTAVASSMIPSAVAAYTDDDVEQWKYNISSAVKFNMIVAIPCAVGFMMLGQPIVKMLFSSSGMVDGQPVYVLGGRMLTAGAVAIVFYALSNVTGGALQSIDKMRLPVIHSAISLVIHILLVMGFLKFTSLGIYALIIGNVTFPVVVFILNLLAIKRYVPSYQQEVIRTFFAPLAAALWMAVVIALVYQGLGLVITSNLLKTLVSIAVAVVVYFALLLLLKGLNKEELFDFPMGRRLYILACKIHVMKEG